MWCINTQTPAQIDLQTLPKIPTAWFQPLISNKVLYYHCYPIMTSAGPIEGKGDMPQSDIFYFIFSGQEFDKV